MSLSSSLLCKALQNTSSTKNRVFIRLPAIEERQIVEVRRLPGHRSAWKQDQPPHEFDKCALSVLPAGRLSVVAVPLAPLLPAVDNGMNNRYSVKRCFAQGNHRFLCTGRTGK